MLNYSYAAAEVMEHFINHDSAHGYSQIHRDGTPEVENITLSDGTDVFFNSGDRDCSRLVQTCYVVVGVLPRNMHMWTGNMRGILLSNGFDDIDPRYAHRGDILLREGHTEMYLGEGIIGGARMSEHGTIDGQTGDQTGNEITSSKYNPYEWEYCFRCTKERDIKEYSRNGASMNAIIHPDGSKDLYYVTNYAVAKINTEQEKLALMDVYKKVTKNDIPMFKVSKPYFDSLCTLYSRLWM